MDRSETIAFISGGGRETVHPNINDGRTSKIIRRLSKSPRSAKRRSSMERVRSIIKSLSPKKDRDGDVFFSPYQGNDTDSSEAEGGKGRQKTVIIASTGTIINEDHAAQRFSVGNIALEASSSDCVNSFPSVVIPASKARPTVSSLGTDSTEDLEAAILSPKCTDLENASCGRRSNRQLVAAQSTRTRGCTREKRKPDHSPDVEAPASMLGVKIAITGTQNRPIHSAEGAKRRRLSKRARTRLTMREINSAVQPGRHYSSLESMAHFEKRKTITIPKIIDFFLRIEGKLIMVNVAISAVITLVVVHTFPAKWQDSLKATSLAVSILGAFLSFALVFRTQTCYDRWWEARTQWGRMTSACVSIAGQARNWFNDEDLVDKFLTHCIVFPYSCKALLRGNQLNDPKEEGPRFLHSGMLTDADLGVIIRHGRPPFTCLEIMRRTMFEAFRQDDQSDISPQMLSAIILSMEQSLWELNLTFGACLKINGTRMPASYTVFMRSFIIFFFVMANLTWAPTLKWLTPIITGFMVFVINTVIVIGDQMMHPFDLQWAGLALQKFCVIIEHEVMNVSRRHADIECLF